MDQTTRPALVFALSLLVQTGFGGRAPAHAAVPETASKPTETRPKTPTPPQGPAKDTMGQAITAPLEDLNLTKDKIPLILELAMVAPYEGPLDRSCAGLAAAIMPLNLALGPDLDVPPSETNPGLLERGSNLAGDAAVGAVRGATEGLIPFRGWVRKLSGAEAHSKKVRAAIAAGAVRRAYLKGLGEAQGCAAPAAALHAPSPPVQP